VFDHLITAGGKLCCDGEQAAIMKTSLQMAEPFIIGCPACLHNFRNLFCTLFCSSDQSTFTNVTAIQHGGRTGSNATNVTAAHEVSFYLTSQFMNDTYDSCKDVIFGSANSRAMTYIGGQAMNAKVRLHLIHAHAGELVRYCSGSTLWSIISLDNEAYCRSFLTL
jgi:Niemann-Pick C1 protein